MRATFLRVVMRRSVEGLWVPDVAPQLYTLPRSGTWIGPCPVPLLSRYPGAIPDYCLTGSGIVVLSQALSARLATSLVQDVTILPTTVDGVPSSLHVMHILSAIDCVDRERSSFELWKEEDGRPDRTGCYRKLERLVLRRELIPSGIKAFRLLGYTTDIFIEESIARKMAAPPFTGVGLYEHEHS